MNFAAPSHASGRLPQDACLPSSPFRCPHCRRELPRVPWVLDLPGSSEVLVLEVWAAGVKAPYELPVVPRLGVRQLAAILGRTVRSTYALSADFTDAGLRLPSRDLLVRTVDFFEWLYRHPHLRPRCELLAERDRRRVDGLRLRTGPRPDSPRLAQLTELPNDASVS